MGLVLVAACAGAFCWGKRQNVDAQTANSKDPFGLKGSSHDGRIVAYIGNHIVSREELGEYLIARFGAERLEFLVNRKIVEMECQKRGVFVTDAEVEERFRADLASFGTKVPLTETEFVKNVLGRFKKSLFEWKEDVIRPKIMMEKLVKSQVTVSDKEVMEGFEARYGPKVECRMIVMQAGNTGNVQEMWNEVRKGGPSVFLEKAKTQFIPGLANEAGKVAPIHMHFGDKKMEETAFRLKPNEISDPIQMPDGMYVILLCEKHIAADPTAKFEYVRTQIQKDVLDLKIAQKIPEVFKKLHDDASPRLVLANSVHHIARVEQPQQGGLRAFDQSPQGPPPSPTNVPAPRAGEVRPPDGHGVVPSLPQVAPMPLSGLNLPKLDPPTENKK
jgi:hypothetical protein